MSHPTGGPWVQFRWRGRDYALDVGDVVEIVAARSATPVPGAGPGLAGIMSWRGQTLPVLDLRSSLKEGNPAPDLQKRMIVLRSPAAFAVRLDEPGRILHAADLDETGPGDEEEARVEGVRWMRWEGGTLQVLDPASILGRAPLVSSVEESQEDPA